MGVFDDIKLGLEQAIEYEKGNLKARSTTLSILPLDTFSGDDIREIRNSTGLTQVLFAKYMGVSVKTVEAWEAGRLLAITRANPTFPIASGIVAI